MEADKIVVFGYSRSGKDTLAGVAETYKWKRIHPIRDYKKFLANISKLPPCILESNNRTAKHNILKNKNLYEECSKFMIEHYGHRKYLDKFYATLKSLAENYETIGEVIIYSWKEFKNFDERFSLPYLEKQINSNDKWILTGIRNKHEFDLVKKLNIFKVWIYKKNCDPLETDFYQSDFWLQLDKPCAWLLNNGNLLQWLITCNDFCSNRINPNIIQENLSHNIVK